MPQAREHTRYSLALAAAIRERRGRKGWSRVDLERASGVSNVTIGRIEKEERVPDAPTLGRLAAGLGTTVSELSRRAEELEPEMTEPTPRTNPEPPKPRGARGRTNRRRSPAGTTPQVDGHDSTKDEPQP